MATDTAEAQALWAKEQVMGRLGVSEPTLYRLKDRAEDPLPSFKLGHLLRFDPGEVEEWLARQRKRSGRKWEPKW